MRILLNLGQLSWDLVFYGIKSLGWWVGRHLSLEQREFGTIATQTPTR
jgi:hypothetical protein